MEDLRDDDRKAIDAAIHKARADERERCWMIASDFRQPATLKLHIGEVKGSGVLAAQSAALAIANAIRDDNQ